MNPESDVGLGGAQLSLGENAFDAAVPVPIAPFVPALSPVQGSTFDVQRNPSLTTIRFSLLYY
jgi:hypothetical protein